MSDSIKRVQVRIAGVAYQLAATNDESHIRKIAAQADEMIRQVLMASPHLSQSMATILALVNAMDETSQASRQLETLTQANALLSSQIKRLQNEFDRLREENWDMRKQKLQLQRLVAEYEKRFDQLQRESECKEEEIHSDDVAAEAELQDNPEDDSCPLTLTSYHQSRLEDFI